MKKLFLVILALIVIGCGSFSMSSSAYEQDAEWKGFAQADKRYSISIEKRDQPNLFYVRFTGKGFEYKEGFETKVFPENAISFTIANSSISLAKISDIHFRVLDSNNNIILTGQGEDKIPSYDSSRHFFYSTTTKILNSDLSFPLRVETIYLSKYNDVFIIVKN